MHTLAILVICYLVIHVLFAGHRYRTSRHHRSWLHRVWISVPGPFHTRIGRRL